MTDKTIYNFEIINHLEYAIKLSPVPLEDTEEFKLCGEIIIPPSRERIFPKINIGKDEIIIEPHQTKNVTAELTELDFSSIGLSTDRSIVQRLKIVDNENGITAGYLSFMCSLLQIRPIMVFDSCMGYGVGNEKYPFGVGGIHISVKKRTHPNFF